MKKIILFLCLVWEQASFAQYYSQCGQDEYVNECYFHNRKGGVFVEIGAHNGITYSNTFFFEKELGWTGICVEPIPERFAELRRNRSCVCIQGCVSDYEGMDRLLLVSSPRVNTEMLSGLLRKYDPRHLHRVDIELRDYGGRRRTIPVNCYLLNTLLERNGISHVDLLSLDTEGGEYDILSAVDFSRFEIDVITVEDNYDEFPKFMKFLSEKGYTFQAKLGCDLLFVHDRLIKGV